MTQETRVKEEQHNWHNQLSEHVIAVFKVPLSGLTKDEAQSRLQTYGPNRLPEPVTHSALLRLLLQFHNILIYRSEHQCYKIRKVV